MPPRSSLRFHSAPPAPTHMDRIGTQKISITNIQATINVGCPLNLQTISDHVRNADWNPQRFSGLIIRFHNPKATALLFRSGKVVLTGTRSEQLSKAAGKKIVSLLQKIGFENVTGDNWCCHNISATYDVGVPIELLDLYEKFATRCTFEPEVFPGLVLKARPRSVVALIFVSGKIVLTGAKSQQELTKFTKEVLAVVGTVLKTPTV